MTAVHHDQVRLSLHQGVSVPDGARPSGHQGLRILIQRQVCRHRCMAIPASQATTSCSPELMLPVPGPRVITSLWVLMCYTS